jgi:hypothetical protein
MSPDVHRQARPVSTQPTSQPTGKKKQPFVIEMDDVESCRRFDQLITKGCAYLPSQEKFRVDV